MSQIIIEDNSGQEFTFNAGDQFSVKLTENRKTGFDWLLTVDGTAIEQVGEIEHDNEDTRVGLAGHLTANFVAKNAGTATLTFVHQKGAAIAKTLTYTITVG